MKHLLLSSAALLVGSLAAIPAMADPVRVTVTVENVVPENGVAFAPLRLGFNSGNYLIIVASPGDDYSVRKTIGLR